ncbi:host attachment protein [Aquabacter sp. L1I39]|uniref:baeRF12 domain-containing protein n=1 Tax=Aquabacter sp. L1I39 TaxID=2820278 RepID=UPI001ADA3B24|nr:host attachment family protein [Aquabacter sp. L1I39]QTL03907.1 host attachment protein [Aquabacter sp. L1I39]
MTKITVPWKGWVFLCDGAKALVLENAGDAAHLDLKTIDVAVQPVPPTRALGTDRPGRVHESAGVSRSAVAETDLHAEAEAEFVKEAVDHLEKAAESHGVKHIVVVAPPRALGIVRDHMGASLKARVQGEVAKDLMNLPVGEIEKHLVA